jgi:hypothetical protein
MAESEKTDTPNPNVRTSSLIEGGHQPVGQIKLTPDSLPKTPSAVQNPEASPQRNPEDSGSSPSSQSNDKE